MARIRIHTFSPLFDGLPAGGPFDLKLLAWLKLAGLPYEQVYGDDPRKGPKGKNPWVEIDGEKMGDTELIIDRLSRELGTDLDAGLTPNQKAQGHAWRRSFEEHFHQVLEWELLIHPAGAAFMRRFFASTMPSVLGHLVFATMQRGMSRQLHARGLARHDPEVIAAKGRADIDALSAFLDGHAFLLDDTPRTADCAVFGQVAPLVYWPMETPVALHARSVPNIRAYCERMQHRCFGRSAQHAAA